MHDYSIRNESKKITYYWISAISILITPLLVELLERVISIVPALNDLYKQINFLGFSISAVLVFTAIWFLFSKKVWKFLAKIKIGKIPDISGTWICIGEGKKYLDSDDTNNWKGVIQAGISALGKVDFCKKSITTADVALPVSLYAGDSENMVCKTVAVQVRHRNIDHVY